MSGQTVPISIDDLRVGITCSHPVEGDHGILLLGANTRITQQVISGLRDRGISSIEVDPRDLAAMRGAGKKNKKAASNRDRAPEGQWTKSKPVKEMLIDRFEEPLNPDRARRLGSAMENAKKRMEGLKALVPSRGIRSVSQLVDVSDGYARSIVDDHDQTIGAVGYIERDFDAEERSVRMSTLGMAIAIELGVDGPQMLDIGMAGLLHDIGLYAMDPKLLDRRQEFSDADWWEYQKHPNISVSCLGDAIDVSESVQLAVQQVHEQFDGSGYPRGLKGQRIHLHARILNVVDAYLRLTSSASRREAIVPHDALGLILHLASRGMFDPQVIRAFLNIETMFPLGSRVELSSGDEAQVIRRPRSGFAAPVVVNDEGDRIEMETTNLEIVRPICDQDSGQIRMFPDEMQNSNWHPAGPDSVV
jgi:HD-GYP domain-containing protein (c-di-GMP phosphodiesterase class II)